MSCDLPRNTNQDFCLCCVCPKANALEGFNQNFEDFLEVFWVPVRNNSIVGVKQGHKYPHEVPVFRLYYLFGAYLYHPIRMGGGLSREERLDYRDCGDGTIVPNNGDGQDGGGNEGRSTGC